MFYLYKCSSYLKVSFITGTCTKLFFHFFLSFFLSFCFLVETMFLVEVVNLICLLCFFLLRSDNVNFPRHKLQVCFQLIIWFEYHIHVKGEVSSLVVNKWQIVSWPHRLAKVASVSGGRFVHELEWEPG